MRYRYGSVEVKMDGRPMDMMQVEGRTDHPCLFLMMVIMKK